jgi:hypothetical protein
MSALPPSNNSNQADSYSGEEMEGALRLGRNGRKTRSWLLVGGCLLALLALAFWRPLQRTCLAFLLLRSEAPSEEKLAEAAEHGEAQTIVLSKWAIAESLPTVPRPPHIANGRPGLRRSRAVNASNSSITLIPVLYSNVGP